MLSEAPPGANKIYNHAVGNIKLLDTDALLNLKSNIGSQGN